MTLRDEGALSAGLNPFIGLFQYTSVTLVLFVLFLILIFTSVKSSIFERKKGGLGFEVKDKEEKGYNRWAKEKEYKEDKDVECVDPLAHDIKAAGIPLINHGRKLWVDNGEYHNLVIGSTGSGKSQTIVEPMVELLIKKGESMIITDPKAELYIAAGDYLKQQGYKVIILNFRDPQKGNAWNPLTLPYQYYKDGNKDKSTELLDDVALNILYDPNNKGEPFWEKSAADYFSGLALGLFEDAKGNEMNINSINAMSTVGEEKFGGGSTYIKEYFTMKGENSAAYVFASNTINAPQDTKGSILSVFRQKIRGFASRENLSEMLSYSDFDMRDIGKEKTAVFICIHDEKTTYHGLATIFIKQVYETLIDVAQENGGKLPYRTNFILDEFANMPPLKDVGTMVTAARSRAIRFTFIIQNFAQLKGVYGPEIAETIKGNCGNLVYLISTELSALEEISKMCGEVKSKDDEKTSSTPLVTVTDLQKLKLFEAIIIRWRLSPLKVKYTPNFEMNWGHGKSNSAFPQREEREIEYFDVKTFVKEKRKKKMEESLANGKGGNSMIGSSPFGGSPFGGSPFGRDSNPFGGGSSPFGGGSSPFGGAPSPFANNNSSPFDDDPFGALGGGKIDYEAMMRDIDKKIAELDAEEARQKEELAKKKKEEKPVVKDAKEVEETKEDKKDVSSNGISLDLDDLEDFVLPKKNEEKEKTDLKDINIQINKEKIEKDLSSDDKKDTKLDIDLLDIEEPKKEISLNKKEEFEPTQATIPVATKSPIEEKDFTFDFALPKVQNADVIKPVYSTDNIKNEDKKNDSLPSLLDNIKDDVKNSIEVKKETDNFVNNISKDSIKERVNENINKMASNDEIKIEREDKPNININPDNVVVNDNMISDDEFFDDFFAE